MFEMFEIEQLPSVTYYIRRGSKQSAVVPKPQRIWAAGTKNRAHTENIGEENP